MPTRESPSVTPHSERLRALVAAGARPSLGFAWPRSPPDGVRRVLPLPRSRAAIAVAAVLFTVMCVPLFAVGLPQLRSDGGLADFSITLFRGFWLLGWAVGTAIPGLALAVLTLSREVLTVRPGSLELRVELAGFGFGTRYAAAEVRNLRPAVGDSANGTAWRGDHLAFDYAGVPIQLGNHLDASAASALRAELLQVLGSAPAPDSFGPIGDQPPQPVPVIDPPVIAPPAPASRLALAGLVFANLVPLFGVLLLGWRVGDIMLLYWAESVIIGLVNIAKLLVIGRWAASFYVPFFTAHYGAFMAGHLLFVYQFFVRGAERGGDAPLNEVGATLMSLWPALLGLAASHLLSFWQNFIGRGEYTRTKLATQMHAPYQRVFIMQFTIIIGGMLSLAVGSTVPALVLLIALKIALDVYAHRGERRRVDAN